MTVAIVAAVALLLSLTRWHRQDPPNLGPVAAQATVSAYGICIDFANATWTSTDPVAVPTGNPLPGTLTTDGTSGTFAPDDPTIASIAVHGHWPDDPRNDVVCAIS